MAPKDFRSKHILFQKNCQSQKHIFRQHAASIYGFVRFFRQFVVGLHCRCVPPPLKIVCPFVELGSVQVLYKRVRGGWGARSELYQKKVKNI